MTYLLLSILSSTAIFITFKISARFKVNLLNLIIINYLVASSLGFYLNQHSISISNAIHSKWLYLALIIGILYIAMFFLIGYSTRNSGVAVTTIASKLSVVVPVLFSIVYFGESKSTFKLLGLSLAALAVLLTSYRSFNTGKNMKLFIIPLVIFMGAGATDSMVKYAQTFYINNQLGLLFPAVIFLSALITGLLYILLAAQSTMKKITLSEVLFGIFLGCVNFGSLYFLILSLNNSKLDSSVVFGLNNLCIVVFSVLFGIVFFQEKLSKVNFAGIIAALAALLILMNF